MSSSENLEVKRSTPRYKEVDGFLLPVMFTTEAFLSALKYEPRPDDLFIVTYPKCGTTWVQNIVLNIYRRGKPFESYLKYFCQTPFLELTGAEGATKMERPGAIKIHLPYRMTPYSAEAKYIFVARNPKDCCVSFYHHTKHFPRYYFEDGSFDDYFELFIEGQVDFGDYFDTLMSWYEHRNDPNVLFITYEELKKDTRKNVLRIAEFLGAQYKNMLESEPEIMTLVLHQSSMIYLQEAFAKMLKELMNIPRELIENDMSLPQGFRDSIRINEEPIDPEKGKLFFRKGIVGDWKNYFSREQNERLRAKFLDRTKGTDIPKLWEDCMEM